MKSKKTISKILVGAMVFMSVTSAGMASVNAQGNTTDRPYNFKFTIVNDERALQSLAKDDYTSCYINNYGSQAGVNADVWATDRVDEEHSNFRLSANCNANGRQFVAKGQVKYLPNYVKENGYNSCTLVLTPGGAIRTPVEGVWSPDSI